MTHVPYLVAGYGMTTCVLAAYASWMVRRRRALTAAAPGAGAEGDLPG